MWAVVIGTSLKIVLVVKLWTMRWVGRIARMTAKGNACGVLVEKPEGKILLGTSRQRWENDITKVKDVGREACRWLRTNRTRDGLL
jgi:hypothetical protein